MSINSSPLRIFGINIDSTPNIRDTKSHTLESESERESDSEEEQLIRTFEETVEESSSILDSEFCTNEEELHAWVCEKCTFKNKSDSISCAICCSKKKRQVTYPPSNLKFDSKFTINEEVPTDDTSSKERESFPTGSLLTLNESTAWFKNLYNLSKFVAQTGHCNPKLSLFTPETKEMGRKLINWVRDIRKNGKDSLSPIRISDLDQFEFWKEEGYNKHEKKETNASTTHLVHVIKESPVQQKKVKNKLEKKSSKKKSQKKCVRIRVRFADRLKAMRRLSKMYGHCFVTTSWTGERVGEYKLGRYQADLRSRKATGTLSKDQERELNKVNFVWHFKQGKELLSKSPIPLMTTEKFIVPTKSTKKIKKIPPVQKEKRKEKKKEKNKKSNEEDANIVVPLTRNKKQKEYTNDDIKISSTFVTLPTDRSLPILSEAPTYKERLQALQLLKTNHGDCNVGINWTGEGIGQYNLGRWQEKMRTAQRCGLLDKKKQEELTKMGLTWHILQSRKTQQSSHYSTRSKRNVKSKRDTSVQNSTSLSHSSFSTKNNQNSKEKKKLYLNRNMRNIGASSNRYTHKHKSFTKMMKKKNFDFDVVVLELEKYKKYHGHFDVPENFHLSKYNLHDRVRSLRQKYYENSLPSEKIEELNKISFAWRSRNEQQAWDSMIRDYKQFIYKHGKTAEVTVSPHVNANKALSDWVIKLRQQSYSGDLSKSIKQELNDINFKWVAFSVGEKKDTERIRLLSNYLYKHGRTNLSDVNQLFIDNNLIDNLQTAPKLKEWVLSNKFLVQENRGFYIISLPKVPHDDGDDIEPLEYTVAVPSLLSKHTLVTPQENIIDSNRDPRTNKLSLISSAPAQLFGNTPPSSLHSTKDKISTTTLKRMSSLLMKNKQANVEFNSLLPPSKVTPIVISSKERIRMEDKERQDMADKERIRIEDKERIRIEDKKRQDMADKERFFEEKVSRSKILEKRRNVTQQKPREESQRKRRRRREKREKREQEQKTTNLREEKKRKLKKEEGIQTQHRLVKDTQERLNRSYEHHKKHNIELDKHMLHYKEKEQIDVWKESKNQTTIIPGTRSQQAHKSLLFNKGDWVFSRTSMNTLGLNIVTDNQQNVDKSVSVYPGTMFNTLGEKLVKRSNEVWKIDTTCGKEDLKIEEVGHAHVVPYYFDGEKGDNDACVRAPTGVSKTEEVIHYFWSKEEQERAWRFLNY